MRAEGAWHQLLISGNGNRWHPGWCWSVAARPSEFSDSGRTRSGLPARGVYVSTTNQIALLARGIYGPPTGRSPSAVLAAVRRECTSRPPARGLRTTSPRYCCGSSSWRAFALSSPRAGGRQYSVDVSGASAQRQFLEVRWRVSGPAPAPLPSSWRNSLLMSTAIRTSTRCRWRSLALFGPSMRAGRHHDTRHGRIARDRIWRLRALSRFASSQSHSRRLRSGCSTLLKLLNAAESDLFWDRSGRSELQRAKKMCLT